VPLAAQTYPWQQEAGQIALQGSNVLIVVTYDYKFP